MRPDGQSQRRVVTAATVPGIVASMPAFLVGATGVLMRVDLGFSPAGLGVAVSVFFVSTSLGAVFTGRLTERIGAGHALRAVCIGSGTALCSIALVARNFASVVVILALVGVANSMFQPASNLALARGIVRRQALMFGVKQSAIPLATLVAGALVPLVAFQFGWRWAFGTAGVVSFALIPVVPRQIGASRSRNGRRHGDHGDVPTSPLVWLAIATGFGTAGATAMATFLVDTGAHYGMSVTRAGWLLVAGSTAGIAARLIVGGLADHPRSRALPIVSGMLLLGGVGYGAISLGAPWLVVVGSIAGYAFGWGWTGLMMFAVVRLNPNAPAAASGIVTVGAAGGAALGPLAFGLLVTHFSYEVAWRTSASATVLAAGLVLIARRWILQHRGDARPVG